MASGTPRSLSRLRTETQAAQEASRTKRAMSSLNVAAFLSHAFEKGGLPAIPSSEFCRRLRRRGVEDALVDGIDVGDPLLHVDDDVERPIVHREDQALDGLPLVGVQFRLEGLEGGRVDAEFSHGCS